MHIDNNKNHCARNLSTLKEQRPISVNSQHYCSDTAEEQQLRYSIQAKNLSEQSQWLNGT